MGSAASTNNKVQTVELRPTLSSKDHEEQRRKIKNSEIESKLFLNTDRNGYNIFHRAATGFSKGIFEEAKQFYQDSNQEQDFANSSEKTYGVTPLAIAILHHREELVPERSDFIRYQLNELHCKIDTMNQKTFWTPIHWAARYGDTATIKILIQKKCKAFIPDYKGYYPIDLAGYFQHQDTLKLLIDYSISSYIQLSQNATESQLMTDFILGEVLHSEDLFLHSDKFLASPVYASKLLYWAARNEQTTYEQVRFILEDMESYPEAMLDIGYFQTPIHGAAICGNVKKLDLMCQEYQSRHKQNKQKNETLDLQQIQTKQKSRSCCKNSKLELKFIRKNTKVKFVSTQFDDVLIKLPKMKLLKIIVEKFWIHLKDLHENDLNFSIPDYQLNTPLHLAAMNNSVECVKSLCEQWGSTVDATNLSGVMAKNMGAWFPDIVKVFQNYQLQVEYAITALDKKDQTALESLSIMRFDSFQNNDGTQLLTKFVSTPRAKNDIENVKQIFKSREILPETPPVTMRLRAIQDIEKVKLNYILRTLIADKFQVKMFPSVYQNEYIVTLDLSQDELVKEAQGMGYLMKLQEFNVKVPINRRIREKLCPFLSKDKQVIINQRFSRLFHIDDLIKDKILVSVVNMHDSNEIHFINKSFREVGLRKYIPFYYYCIRNQLKFRDKKSQDLISFENYFGEFVTLQYSAKVFYTMCMMPITFFSIYITIQQMVETRIEPSFINQTHIQEDQQDYSNSALPSELSDSPYDIWIIPENPVCILFAIVMSLWVTIILELWKRKESRIISQLGLNPMHDNSTKLNPDYTGYSKFSWTRFNVTRKSAEVNNQKAFFILNCIFCILMAAISTGCYFILKFYVRQGFWCGILITFISTITSYFQRLGTNWLIKKSNIKYLQENNQMFISCIMAFRFANVNLPIAYAIFFPLKLGVNQERQYLHYSLMYQLILSLIGSKCLSFLVMSYGSRILLFYVRRWSYFLKMHKKAKKQTTNYNKCNISPEELKNLKEKGDQFIFKNVIPTLKDSNAPEVTTKNRCCACYTNKIVQPLTYMRLVLSGTERVSAEQLFTDAIELGSLMPKKSELTKICDMTEKYVIFSLGVLYAGLCPIATILVYLFYLIDSFIEMKMDCYIMQRGLPDIQTNLNFWNNFAEIICIVAVISNSYLLFNFSLIFETLIANLFGVDGPVLYIVCIQEHIVLIILVFIKYVIPDLPKKIKKKQERTKSEIQTLHKVDLNPQDSLRVQQLEREIEILHNKLDRQLVKQMSPIEIIQYHEKDKSEIDIKDGKLSDFLQLDPRQHNYKQMVDQIDIALKVNLEIRLYRETFYLIERAVLQRKLAKITQYSNVIQISCVQCSNAPAILFCAECQDHFCDNCSQVVHKVSPIYQKHPITKININPMNFVLPSQNIIKKIEIKEPLWRKFEYFNFPLNPLNPELYHQIQMHFEYLKKVYLDLNYINTLNGTIDLASVFVDQNYDSLQRDLGNQFRNDQIKKFGDKTILYQKETLDSDKFNDEELFYLNRIAFRLFKKSGSQVRFDKFYNHLHTLQHGDFDLRLKLWLKLINEMEETVSLTSTSDINLKTNLISKAKFITMLRASYPQDLNGLCQIDTIIDSVFGLDSVLPMEQIQQLISGNKEAKLLVGCVIQWSESAGTDSQLQTQESI